MGEEALDIDDIPIETLDLNVDIEMSKGIEGLASADKYYREAMKAEKSKKKSKRFVVHYFIMLCITSPNYYQ